MTIATQEAPTEAPKFTLAPPRKAPRKGMPTKGALILITGLPKSGKNTLALSYPGLGLLEMEKHGSDHLDGWVQETDNLDTFRSAFRALLDSPECRAIGVSTLDKLIGWWQDEIVEQYQVASMSTKIEGGDNLWQVLRGKIETFVEVSKHCDKNVIALCHFKEPKLDKDGRLVVAHNIDAPGKIGSYLCSEADLIGVCSKAKVGNRMQYKISFVGGGEVGAYGGRIKELEGKEIILPETNQWAAIEAEVNKALNEKPAAPKSDEKPAAAKAAGKEKK
jgi:hypothetical protein